ncbi:MAG: right-handed parallel beta-helix repeat-containing protein [Treponema sp.]|jgi:predicted outer membrane repeat protein|nr:right-handed parallel beta-helix repeat-containing protein [Treponema sp.]
MKKKNLFIGIALLFSAIIATPLFAQTADRSYYVDLVKGNDENNGRSVENAFESLQKAFELIKKTTVKKITFVQAGGDYSRTNAEDTGDAEILITSMDPKAEIRLGSFYISGKSKVRFESIKIVRSEFLVSEGAQVVVGKDVEIYGVGIVENSKLTIGSNAKIISTRSTWDSYDYEGIRIRGNAKVLIKDDVTITGSHHDGISIGSGELIIQDNVTITTSQGNNGTGNGISIRSGELIIQDNVKISGCSEAGLNIERGKVTLKGSVVISDNTGGGIRMITGDLTIQDEVSITSNKAQNNGGGICFSFSPHGNQNTTAKISGNVVISNNSAKYGGGIYIRGATEKDYHYIGEEVYNSDDSVREYRRPGIFVVMEGSASIKDNKATEGGGVFIAEGSVMSHYIEDLKKNTLTITQKVGGFEMRGGTISGNKADYGAGIYVAATELSIPEEEGEYDKIHNDFIVVYTDKNINMPAFTHTGGSITANEAEFVGGGIYVKNKGAYAAGKGTITDNTAGDGEGENLYQLE